MPRVAAWVVVLLVALTAAGAHAEDEALSRSSVQAEVTSEPGAQPTASSAMPRELRPKAWLKPGVLAASLALVPGFVVHGAGSFAIGERTSAKRLVIAESAGLVVLVGAGALLARTGTARRMVGALIPLTIFGFGAFALSWLADIYAAATGGRDASGPGFVPNLDVELGYLYVHDPQFRYGSFATLRADLRASAFRASPMAWIALDDDNQRLLLELAYRPLGRTPSRRFSDGSFVELATGVRYHRFGSERFAVTTSEWHLDGRLDLARVGPAMRGAFVEGQLGAGLELYQFRVRGSRLEDNAFGLLLARFGFGVYLGSGPRSGELVAYYDHRHDDFAAGLGVKGIASGPLGHFGLSGRYFFGPSWGLNALCELGSAVVAGAAVNYRHAQLGGG